MVSRIEVIPTEVRGYGNIVEAKSLSDFVPVESDLVYSENVYSLTAVSGVHISLTVSSSSINVGSSVTLTATVMDDDTPVTGETVSFYDGETLLGTDTSDSSGVATYSTSALTVGSHSLSATYDDKTSNTVSVTVNKIASTISLSAASSTITYGSNVSLSGTLSVGSGCSVKIYQGSTLIDTVTTTTGGAFTKTVTGLSVGSYTFKATYEGDSTHSNVTSSNVSVTVNKATPTITLSVPSTGTVGTSYTVSGTLTVDGSVKLYENGSLKDTLTVSSGSFSKSITQSTASTYSYYVVYEGSSTYESVTSSTGSIVVSDVAPSYDGVSLTSDKSILSYADSESATLTAQLLDGSSSASVSGVTVEFFKGSTSLGTATTNSSGVATKSYSSTGAGDVSLTASAGTFVSEIYGLEDCIDYDALTSNNNKFTLTGSANINYSSNGLSMVGSANATSLYLYKGTLPSDFVFECDVVSYTVGAYNWSAEICVSHTGISNGVNNGNKTRFGTFADDYSGTGFTYTDVSRIDAPYHLKVEIDNGTATFYIDNVQSHQRTAGTADFGMKSYNNRGAVIKNIKVKPL